MKKILWIVATLVLIVFGAGQYVNWSNSDLSELTRIRRSTLTELQPVLLRYKLETGGFPPNLESLVPKYLPEIPAVLRNPPDVEPVKRIQYESTGELAHFRYHVIRGPDSTEIFDVAGNRFERNK